MEEKQIKTLILNGARTENETANTVSDYLVESLKAKGHEVDVMILRKEKIGACLGCFGCWLKTPGECVIHDAGSDLPEKGHSKWPCLSVDASDFRDVFFGTKESIGQISLSSSASFLQEDKWRNSSCTSI